jgi:hypothetical protein
MKMTNKNIWKIAKDDIFETETNAMDKIYYNNKMYNGSKVTAEQINICFQDQIKN